MKFSKIIYRRAMGAATALLLGLASMNAGILTELPTIRVNGKVMYYYDAQSGDNIYTIADKLGVSVSQIRQYNPSVADGVKPRMRLLFPSDITTTETDSTDGPVTHVVKKGESIYGIAHQYGTTVEALTALNPAAANGVRPGQRLLLTASAAAPSPSASAASSFSAVSPSSSASSSSASPSSASSSSASPSSASPLTSSSSVASSAISSSAQPAVSEDSGLSEAKDSASAPSSPSTSASLASAPSSPSDSSEPTAEAAELAPRNVAIILPFMLSDAKQSRQTQLYTEFYKGFLLAAEEENAQGKAPVNLKVFDSAANLDSVRAIMHLPQMKDINLIVAPDNPSHLSAIAAAAPQDALILNVFAVKDTTFRTIPGMIQTNIPHDEMYAIAINSFLSSFANATPVFLTRKNGRTDKEEFTDMLKVALSRKGIVYRTIHFDGYLADADLEDLDPTINSYIFIPASGNRDEFSRISHALKSFKEKALMPEDVQLFGYPEWATFRGDQLREISELQTSIYSRYNPTEHSQEAKGIERKFQQTYSEGILDKQMPVLGILGYDTGKMVLEAVRNIDADGSIPTDFHGIQSGMRLERADNGGYFNNALFLITYRPDGNVSSELR